MLTLVYPGEHAELQRQESVDGHSFQQGDKVKCLLEVDILRQMQEGHGGWNPKMAEVLNCFLQDTKTNNTIQMKQLTASHKSLLNCSIMHKHKVCSGFRKYSDPFTFVTLDCRFNFKWINLPFLPTYSI